MESNLSFVRCGVIFAFLALLVVQCNFGFLPVAQKISLTVLTPWTLYALRSLAGALVFQIAYQVWRWRRRDLGVDSGSSLLTSRQYLFLSFLGIASNQFLLILALSFTQAMATVIMVPSITLFTFLFAIVLKKEAFTWARAFTLGLGGVGVLVLMGDSLHTMVSGMGARALLGNILCLISALAYALYLVLSRDSVRRIPPLEFTSRLFSYSLVWVVIFLGLGYFLVPHETWTEFWWNSPVHPLAGKATGPSNLNLIAVLSFIVAGPTVLNYFLNLWSLQHLPASTVSGFISLQTLIGAAASSVFLHEKLKPTYGVAALCILGSVLLLSFQTFLQKKQVQV